MNEKQLADLQADWQDKRDRRNTAEAAAEISGNWIEADRLAEIASRALLRLMDAQAELRRANYVPGIDGPAIGARDFQIERSA